LHKCKQIPPLPANSFKHHIGKWGAAQGEAADEGESQPENEGGQE
jgi:hypothetical protein